MYKLQKYYDKYMFLKFKTFYLLTFAFISQTNILFSLSNYIMKLYI